MRYRVGPDLKYRSGDRVGVPAAGDRRYQVDSAAANALAGSRHSPLTATYLASQYTCARLTRVRRDDAATMATTVRDAQPAQLVRCRADGGRTGPRLLPACEIAECIGENSRHEHFGHAARAFAQTNMAVSGIPTASRSERKFGTAGDR